LPKSATQPVLPDLLADGLAIVFCGTAPGTVSAARGHYYAHPQNKFWRTLYEIGLTPRLLAPSEYTKLLQFGIGLTDIAKTDWGMDKELPRGALGKDAIASLRERIARHSPRILAFTSLTGGRKFVGSRAVFGLQADTIGCTHIWILPSPSPAAHWNWDPKPWHALARDAKAA
jgi:TDG/mug DNA glycosylase family protein